VADIGPFPLGGGSGTRSSSNRRRIKYFVGVPKKSFRGIVQEAKGTGSGSIYIENERDGYRIGMSSIILQVDRTGFDSKNTRERGLPLKGRGCRGAHCTLKMEEWGRPFKNDGIDRGGSDEIAKVLRVSRNWKKDFCIESLGEGTPQDGGRVKRSIGGNGKPGETLRGDPAKDGRIRAASPFTTPRRKSYERRGGAYILLKSAGLSGKKLRLRNVLEVHLTS